MNIRLTGTLCVLMTMALAVAAQTSNTADWVGVWYGELSGQPGAILTLAKDNGTLEGTLVLNIVNNEGGRSHIVAHEPHVLVGPRVEGNVLSFQIKRIDGSGDLADFTVTLVSPSSATIHCSSCGSDAPAITIAKEE